MPSGYTHEKLNISATSVVAVVAPTAVIALGGTLATATLVTLPLVSGLLMSIIITPDLLDVDADPLPERRIRVVPGLGRFYAWVFDVVSVRIPHRGFPSHGWGYPVGSLLGFLLTLPVVLALFLPAILGWVDPWVWSGLVVLGKMIGDGVHCFADWLTTGAKHTRTRTRKRWRKFWE